jgi:hypothetical protein
VIDCPAAAAAAAAALWRKSGFTIIYTSSSMSAAFEVFCTMFARAIFIAACAAGSASALVSAIEMVDSACTSSGWEAGPFELADMLGARAVSQLLVEFGAICERQSRHVGVGLRLASHVTEIMCHSADCKSFWSWSKNGNKSNVSPGIAAIIQTITFRMDLPRMPLTFWNHYYIHLQILMAACEACLSLLRRRAVANPEVLDLLLVASGYPANQGGVIECARNTAALSDYEDMISFAGANALDSPSWREAYAAFFEWKAFPDRPRVMPCQSVSGLSRRSPAVERNG